VGIRALLAKRSVVAAAVALAVVPPANGPDPGGTTVTESGIWGGGFINVLAQNPVDAAKFLIGGDVSGLHSSTDYGTTWATSNGGLNDPRQDTIASIAYRRGSPRVVFAAYGSNGGGVLRSLDGGSVWKPFGPPASEGGANFQGHDSCGQGPYPDPCYDPRPTGNLLVLVEGPQPRSDLLYAGAFGRGLMRIGAGGAGWTTVALGSTTGFCTWGDPPEPGCYVTSLVRDPRRRNVMFVGTHGNGAFRITGTDCQGDGCAEGNVTPIGVAPGSDPIIDAEELWFQETPEGPVLMCACGQQGFYRGFLPFTTLEQSNAGLAFDPTPEHETSYTAIGGQPLLPTSSVYLGNVNSLCEVPPGGRHDECHTVYRSTDAGVTWTDVVFAEDIQKTVAGTTIDWWEFLCCRDSMINQESYGASSIAVTDESPPRVLVAGRSGIWKTTADGDTHWQPAVQNLGATTNNDVVTDPRDPNRVYVGNTDWTVFASSSRLDPGTVVQSEPGTAFTKGFALAVDGQSTDPVSLVYLGSGAGEVDVGGVHWSADPTMPGPNPWTTLELAIIQECDRDTPRVIGVGVGRADPGSTPLVFAATDGCGLWRNDGARWQNVSKEKDMFAEEDGVFEFAPISYPNNLGETLFVLDRKTGKLWESVTQGGPGSWVNVWTVPDPEAVDPNTGFLAADPNEPGTVWVTTNHAQGMHKLACPDPPEQDGCVDQVIPPPNVVNPGPIAIRPCSAPCVTTLYVATRAVSDSTVSAAMFKHTSGNDSWCGLTSAVPLYARAANFPAQIAASAEVDGVTTLYVTTRGEGTLVVTDDSPDCAP
jgi:hypothetical protein